MRRTPKLKRHLSLVAVVALVLGVVAAGVVLLAPGTDGSAAADVHPATAGRPVAFDTHSGALTATSLLADPSAASEVALYAAQADADRQVAAYLQAVALQQAAQQQSAQQAAQQQAAQRAGQQRSSAGRPSPGGTSSCGGDLPPCCVMMRESHGNPSVVNGSSGASGKWQFMPATWNNYMGYPSAASAPAWVQDQKARQVYAGGAGSSHWAGPGC